MLVLLGACQPAFKENTVRTHSFSLRDMAKSHIDKILELQLHNSTRLLKELMKKLYLRNPEYWRYAGFQSADSAVNWAFAPAHRNEVQLKCLRKSSIDSIHLAFDETFGGDRVLAFCIWLVQYAEQCLRQQNRIFPAGRTRSPENLQCHTKY